MGGTNIEKQVIKYWHNVYFLAILPGVLKVCTKISDDGISCSVAIVLSMIWEQHKNLCMLIMHMLL